MDGTNDKNGAYAVIGSAKRTNGRVAGSQEDANDSTGKRAKVGPASTAASSSSETKLAPIFRRAMQPSSSKASQSDPATQLVWNKPLGHELSCLAGEYGKAFAREIERRKASDNVGSVKVACFDLDGCVVTPKNGKTFPSKTDPYDFQEAFRGTFAEVKRAYEEEGACIAIISNQYQSDVRSKQLETWKEKMKHIALAIDCPFVVFAALSKDGFRKPGRLMWDCGVVESYVAAGGKREDIVNSVDGGPLIDSATFFVGDAAGRVGDHSDTDRKWAMNIGMPFYTPEEFFLKQKPKTYKLSGWRPTLPSANDESGTILPANFFSPASGGDTLDLVLFVGSPGSGKTTFYKNHFAHRDYAWVNQDTLRTASKCLSTVRSNLQQGRSVVVDNTNRNAETRSHYIKLAQSMPNVRVRCIFFDVPKEVCKHNNFFRVRAGLHTSESDIRTLLPEIAFSSYFANVERPQRSEGFDSDVIVVKWTFSGSEEARRRWLMRWD